MGEPLKDKESYCQSWELVNLKDIRECNHTTKVFEEKDIKSAVEWLKDMYKVHIKNIDKSTREQLFDYIEEAFPDLYPKKPT